MYINLGGGGGASIKNIPVVKIQQKMSLRWIQKTSVLPLPHHRFVFPPLKQILQLKLIVNWIILFTKWRSINMKRHSVSGLVKNQFIHKLSNDYIVTFLYICLVCCRFVCWPLMVPETECFLLFVHRQIKLRRITIFDINSLLTSNGLLNTC